MVKIDDISFKFTKNKYKFGVKFIFYVIHVLSQGDKT